MDVQPALRSDGWDTDPFVMEEKNGKFYGRGTTDDKGPVLGWVNVIEAFQKTNTELPINFKFCLEGKNIQKKYDVSVWNFSVLEIFVFFKENLGPKNRADHTILRPCIRRALYFLCKFL